MSMSFVTQMFLQIFEQKNIHHLTDAKSDL